MRKFVAFIPLILAALLAVYSQFDASVWAWLVAHPRLTEILGVLFVLSEALGGVSFIKANSVAQAVLDTLVAVLKKVLHK